MKKFFTLFIMLTIIANIKAICQDYGKAIQLNGTTDYVSIGNMGTMPLQGSITFWIQPTDLGNYNNVLTTGGLGGCSGGNNAVRFEVGAAYGTFYGAIGETGGCDSRGGVYTTNMAIGGQYHIVLTWNQTANNIKGYMNGNLVFDQVHTLWNATFNDVIIGAGWHISRKWRGSVDEVTFWNKELTAPEVINIRNDIFSRSDANLIAYYSFDNNSINGKNQVVPNDRNPGTYNGTTIGTASTPIFTPSFVIPYICNGLTVYADGDGDGYGSVANSLFVVDCVAPNGYVYDSTDCDDNNPDINPGASEVCDDGIDNNCNGEIDEGCPACIPPKIAIEHLGNLDICQTHSVLLSANGNSGKGYSYKWMRDDIPIPGAIFRRYTATIAGSYIVLVKNNLGCSTLSDPAIVTSCSTIKDQNNQVQSRPTLTNKSSLTSIVAKLKVAPNPVAKTLNIVIEGLLLNKKSAIYVLSISGVTIKTIQPNTSNKTVQLDVSSFRPGTYIIKVINGGKVMYKKFVKL